MQPEKNKPHLPEPEDDGRTVAPMNVEGMPWYSPRPENTGSSADNTFSKWEARQAAKGALAAALTVAAVFAVGFGLFLLFAVKVWFA